MIHGGHQYIREGQFVQIAHVQVNLAVTTGVGQHNDGLPLGKAAFGAFHAVGKRVPAECLLEPLAAGTDQA